MTPIERSLERRAYERRLTMAFAFLGCLMVAAFIVVMFVGLIVLAREVQP